MDEALYRRAREVFDEVIVLPAQAREEAIAQAVGDHPTLAGLVRRLVAFDTQAGLLDTVDGVGLSRVVVDTAQVDVMPAEIGGLRILRELGRGGMGVVYEAEQDRPRRRVAVKTLSPLSRSPEALALFTTEVDALARVLHPGIPQVYEVLEVDGMPYMSMEHVDGVPLLHAVFLLDLPDRARLLADIADAVEHAHRRGVIHRDLKPSNVLVTADGQPKVLDFGIARLDERYKPGIGTLVYLAPDQFSETPPDARSDVYSLGAMAWEVLVGVPPFHDKASSAELLYRAKVTAAPPALPPEVPQAWVEVVLRALSPFPEDRYPTADAFAQAMRRLADPPEPTEAPATPRRWPAVVVAAVGAAVVGGAAWWWWG